MEKMTRGGLFMVRPRGCETESSGQVHEIKLGTLSSKPLSALSAMMDVCVAFIAVRHVMD
jgi:hypothetical protein